MSSSSSTLGAKTRKLWKISRALRAGSVLCDKANFTAKATKTRPMLSARAAGGDHLSSLRTCILCPSRGCVVFRQEIISLGYTTRTLQGHELESCRLGRKHGTAFCFFVASVFINQKCILPALARWGPVFAFGISRETDGDGRDLF